MVKCSSRYGAEEIHQRQTDDNGADDVDKQRIAGVTHTVYVAENRESKGEEQEIELEEGHILNACCNDFLIGSKDGYDRGGNDRHHYPEYDTDSSRNKHADAHTLMAAVGSSRALILGDHCGNRAEERARGDDGHTENSVGNTCGGGGHITKLIHHSLKHDEGCIHQKLLTCSGQTETENALCLVFVNTEAGGAEIEGKILAALDVYIADNNAGRLTDSGCKRRARSSHIKPRNADNIADDVEHAGNSHENHRSFALAYAAENAGDSVVKAGKHHTHKADAHISLSARKSLCRGVDKHKQVLAQEHKHSHNDNGSKGQDAEDG